MMCSVSLSCFFLIHFSSLLCFIQAAQQRLDRGKVPCVCGIVKAVSLTEADASVLLKDPTGKMEQETRPRVKTY